MEIVSVVLLAAAAGSALTWMLLSRNLHRETERRAAAEAGAMRVPALEQSVSELQAQNGSLRAAEAGLRARLEAGEKLADTFRSLSADALHASSEQFLRLANEVFSRHRETGEQAIGGLVKPLSDSLEKLSLNVGELERRREAAYGELRNQLGSLAETQVRLQTETANLVRALRAPQARGRWGELQLRRVVELAGMKAHCDFTEQATIQAETGRLRPDLIVHLPGGREVVVDAKVSLAAYLDALECTDDAARLARLQAHSGQVREHLRRLAGKAYWAQFDTTPEFVVAFLPGEVFFSAALEQDPGLIEYGIEQRVIPATPTTLIALLKAVAYGWRQEDISNNARAISDLGKELYDRLRTLAIHFGALGANLDRTLDAYNKSVGTLESRVLVSARRFKDQGATAGDDIPVLEPSDRTARALQAPELQSWRAITGD
ncbi:MAG: DNA recombination protein RmuC [Acidobacteria bacterium]|nr:DNA recombination protein RmuC [Acidobacteriota bacterium]